MEYERLKSIGMAYARVPNQSDVHSSESAAMRSESAAVELPDDAKGSGGKADALRAESLTQTDRVTLSLSLRDR